jgi:putative two-component system response regulator
LRRNEYFDLVVIDVATEQKELHETCRRLKNDPQLELIPVLVMLRRDQAELRRALLQAGATCITVPDESGDLEHQCRNLIRTKHATDVFEDSEKVILMLARIIEGKDKYTQGHVERVSAYCVQLGQRMGLSDAQLAVLQKGGIVHDIGKIAVPDAVLNKAGPLTDDEYTEMKRHTVVGYDLLYPLRTFGPVLPIVRWHHERPNGTGYPDGIGGDDLPILARIASVADCFDAVTTSRPYRQGLSIEEALSILEGGAAKGEFDPDVVAVMRETVAGGDSA